MNKTIKRKYKRRKTMNKRKMRKKGGGGDECSICLSDITKPENEITLSCAHKFHKGCIREAVKVTKKCPNCRAEINDIDYHNIMMGPGYNFENVAVFKRYINSKLKDYTEDPTKILIRELKEIGTNYTPTAVVDTFMEFELETNLSGEQRFKFTRLIPPNEEITKIPNKKYFKYEQNDSYFFVGSDEPLVESLVEWPSMREL